MSMMKQPCVYILASRPLGTLYIGVTSDLHKRMAEHSQGLIDGFSKRYEVKRLVYYEHHREARLKEWHRIWKIRLIERMNPEWLDLFDPNSGEIAFGSQDVESPLSNRK
jgi:putative endonuclease